MKHECRTYWGENAFGSSLGNTAPDGGGTIKRDLFII